MQCRPGMSCWVEESISMNTQIHVQPPIAQPPKPRYRLAILPAITAACLLYSGTLHATTAQPTAQSTTPQTAVHKTAHTHKRTSTATPPAPAPQPQPAPELPPAPKPPDWPVNDHPADATVLWNS